MRHHRKKTSDARPCNQASFTEQDVRKRLMQFARIPTVLKQVAQSKQKGAGYYQTKISKKGARKYLKNTFLASLEC